MSKQITKIDVADAVMHRIKRENIQMRSSRYFVLRRVLWTLLFIGSVLLSVLLLLALGYAVRNDVFTEYLSMPGGVLLFVRSLPLGGIVLCIIAVFLSISVARKLSGHGARFKPAQVFMAAGVFVAITMALGGVGLPGRTPQAFALVSFLSSRDPIKLTGTIESYADGIILVQTSEGIVSVHAGALPQGLGPGDKILVLGTERSGFVTPKAIKLLSKALPAQEEVKADVITESVATDTPAPAPTPKPVQPAPAPAPKPAPAPAPESAKTISIVAVGGPVGTAPNRKYQINWSANYKLENGYKLVWELSPAVPAWPTSNYKYDSTASSGGTTYVRETLGAGTYNVRLCEYVPGTSTCLAYSNQVTIVFP